MTTRARRIAAATLAAAIAAAAWIRCAPLPHGFTEPERRVSTQIVDREGRALYEALSDEGGRSRPIGAADLPPALVAATMAAEDHRFRWHPGVDPLAIVRALWHDVRARRLAEGGSTITQQVVKALSVADVGRAEPATPARPRRRSLGGKLREMVLALRLEHRLTKDEIMALYLSVAPYGNQYVGAEAASRGYFGVPAASLTPAQAAFLAALPQRPSAFNPYRNLAGALERQRWVITRMESTGLLAPADAAQARVERLSLRRDARSRIAPHFVERVRAAVGDETTRRIETTLDAELQSRVQGIMAAHHERLLKADARNASVAVLDNRTGEWLAWEGSGTTDGSHGSAIDGVVTPRQPGSALKPFTYALAFEGSFHPASILPDLPSHFPTAVPGVLYSPRNYDGLFRGPMRARAALAGSENVPAVFLLSRVGVADLLRLLRRAGLSTLEKTPDHYGFGLTMGDAEVRLDELVAGYSALARGGVALPPRLVRAVVTAAGERREAERAVGERIVSARAAFWVGDILSDNEARAWAFGSGGSLEFPFPVAAKTGTSQAYHDNWTVGYTREVTVGVWVGNFDRTPLRNSSGVTGAAPLFHDVMLAAQQRVSGRAAQEEDEGRGLLPVPSNVVRTPVCALSGLPAGDACPSTESEWLPAGEQAVASCHWHRHAPGRTLVAWPPAYRSWARQRGLVDERALAQALPSPAWRDDGRRAAAARRRVIERLTIANPPSGATYLKDPTLRAEFQTLPLRAVAAAGRGPLTWMVDGRQVGSADSDAAVEWPLAVGRHRVEVRDASGESAEATILVK